MTKIEMYEAIKTAVAENEEMVKFLVHEIELIAKRNASRTSKLTKSQRENLEVKTQIGVYLKEHGADKYRAREIAEALDISPNKATALLTQLVKGGDIERVEEKGVAYFRALSAEADE